MSLAGKAHTVRPGEGRVADMGAVTMRALAADDATTGGAFAFTEFSGGEGAWTVPHRHHTTAESFYVLDGEFTFTLGEEQFVLGPGSYILIPHDASHMIHAGTGGGRLLALMVPGGLEKMFYELADLPPGGITDPAVRAEVSTRHDSVPA